MSGPIRIACLTGQLLEDPELRRLMLEEQLRELTEDFDGEGRPGDLVLMMVERGRGEGARGRLVDEMLPQGAEEILPGAFQRPDAADLFPDHNTNEGTGAA